MRRSASFLLGLVLAFAAIGRAQETPPAPPPPSPTAEQPAASAAQEVLRLKEAGYSEEFLLNKIRRENKTYVLSTDDLVSLRKAGLSETVIEALLRSGNPPSGAPAAAPTPAPANGAPAPTAAPTAPPAAAPAAQASPAAAESSPAVSPAPTPSAAPGATADLQAGSQTFDGLVRQKRGFLGIGGSKKKAIGKLVIDKEQIHWYQAVDPEDNFSSFVKNIKEMWMNCAPRAGENLCLELCFKTYSGDEWCFRDAGWDNGTNKQVTAIFDYFEKTFPATFFSKREKKSF
jgi:hypothetical protein